MAIKVNLVMWNLYILFYDGIVILISSNIYIILTISFFVIENCVTNLYYFDTEVLCKICMYNVYIEMSIINLIKYHRQ